MGSSLLCANAAVDGRFSPRATLASHTRKSFSDVVVFFLLHRGQLDIGGLRFRGALRKRADVLDVALGAQFLDRALRHLALLLIDEVMQSAIKELRAKGNIEYVGSFAKSAAEAKPADVKLPSVEKEEDDHIRKGLSGVGR